jgi:hypothetical protein
MDRACLFLSVLATQTARLRFGPPATAGGSDKYSGPNGA